MILKNIKELAWRWYQNGKAYASDQHLRQQDIEFKLKLLIADALRQRYYESKQLDGRPDPSPVSSMLTVMSFELGDPDGRGMRRLNMGGVNMYRLPSNSHIPNIWPSSGGCGTDEVGQITQVDTGEENFYINSPDHKDFKFFVIKGGGLNTYNIPPCVKGLDVEATFDIGDSADIDMGIASMAVDQLLGVALGIKKQYYSEGVAKEMESQNVIK